MKKAALICGLACAPVSASAYVDYICEFESGSYSFVIDLSGQTITQSGFDPLAFEEAAFSAYPIATIFAPKLVGRVDTPLPNHIVPGGFVGFALAENLDGKLVLIENFSDPVAHAFASIADVMEHQNGIPCTATEAD